MAPKFPPHLGPFHSKLIFGEENTSLNKRSTKLHTREFNQLFHLHEFLHEDVLWAILFVNKWADLARLPSSG